MHPESRPLEHPNVDWFATRAVDQAEAVAVCTGCLMRDECLTSALEHNEQGGWGATTDAERRVMRQEAVLVHGARYLQDSDPRGRRAGGSWAIR